MYQPIVFINIHLIINEEQPWWYKKIARHRKNIELQKKVAELERILGQKQMVIDYQNKLIEIASKELDVDIKKFQSWTLEQFRMSLTNVDSV